MCSDIEQATALAIGLFGLFGGIGVFFVCLAYVARIVKR